MNKFSDVVVMLAQQRSGTTAFRRALSGTSIFSNYGEVFHENTFEGKGNFFGYISKNEDRMRRFSFPKKNNMETLFVEYISHIRELTRSRGKKFSLIDIKHNSTHNFNELWQKPLSVPNLFGLVKKYGLRIIYVERKGVFNQALSSVIALNMGKWHLTVNESHSDNVRVTLDPAKILEAMRRIDDNNALLRRWIEPIGKTRSLYYEDLFDESGISNHVIKKLSEFLKVDLPQNVKVPLKKITRSPKDMIDNSDELLAFFSQGEYEGQILKALS
jgi:LPS sulfotransferase NodH